MASRYYPLETHIAITYRALWHSIPLALLRSRRHSKRPIGCAGSAAFCTWDTALKKEGYVRPIISALPAFALPQRKQNTLAQHAQKNACHSWRGARQH